MTLNRLQSVKMSHPNQIPKPASVLQAENDKMAQAILKHYMNICKCSTVEELIKDLETVLKIAKDELAIFYAP